MKLNEIHTDQEPLIIIMVRKLLQKQATVHLKIANKAVHDWTIGDIRTITCNTRCQDYTVRFLDARDGIVRMCFMPIKMFDTLELTKDQHASNLWYLTGNWNYNAANPQ